MVSRRCGRARDNRENEAHSGAFVGLALYFKLSPVSLGHAIHHCKSQTSASLALGGKERLKTFAPYVLRHPDPSVTDIHAHPCERLGFGQTS